MKGIVNWPQPEPIGLYDAIAAAGFGTWGETAGGVRYQIATDASAVQAIIDGYNPLPACKAKVIAAVKSLLPAKIGAGYTSGAHTYQIDDQAQANIVAVEVMFNRGVADAHGGYWRSKANVDVSMTEAEVKALFLAIGQYKMGLIRNAQALVNSIAAAADMTALAAIDINAGWPAQG